MARNRDTQLTRVYAAEDQAAARWQAAGNSILLPRKHKTIEQDAQWFVRQVSDWKRFREITPRIQKAVAHRPTTCRNRIAVTVKREGSTWSHGGSRWIEVKSRGTTVMRPQIHMAPIHLQRMDVLLHECGHWVGELSDLGHGPKFAMGLLELTERFISPDYADLLRAAYADKGVDAYWG